MNGLMIAFAFSLPYHLLRTATAAGARVHVLGSGPSRGLRASRYCASYHQSVVTGNGEDDHEILLEEIRRLVRQHRIDIVFPSDDVSTRLLAAIRDRLPVRATPLPDLATFDLLNDKSNFTRFALDHGVRVPEGWLRATADEVRRDIRAGTLPLPLTIKPTNRSGGIGVIHIRDDTEIGLLDKIDYRPLLIQRHIVGETIGISVICCSGRIIAHATQRRDHRRFQLFANPDLVDNVDRLVAATGLNGPANLDAVLEEATGLSYIVECNPRFWFTIYLSMIVGLNFLDFAFANENPSAGEIATLASGEIQLSPKPVIRHPWKASRQDWKLIFYHWRDPLAYLLERRKTFDDREVAVEAARMRSYTGAGPQPPTEPRQELVA